MMSLNCYQKGLVTNVSEKNSQLCCFSFLLKSTQMVVSHHKVKYSCFICNCPLFNGGIFVKIKSQSLACCQVFLHHKTTYCPFVSHFKFDSESQRIIGIFSIFLLYAEEVVFCLSVVV